jgi:hypothetical protein
VEIATDGIRGLESDRVRVVRVGDFDPDLFDAIGPEAGTAKRRSEAKAMQIGPGPWDFAEAAHSSAALAQVRDQKGSLGLLLLDGLFWREIEVGSHSGIEVLGPGDLLRPWVRPLPESELLSDSRWTVLDAGTVAMLDRGFALRMVRWPSIAAALMDRMILRASWLSFHLAICHVRGLPDRLLLAMWHFADRWGRVVPGGVSVPVRLTHRMLAQLVGARRPSVTSALRSLKEAGKLEHRDDGTWLLRGRPPSQLRGFYDPVRDAAGTSPAAAAARSADDQGKGAAESGCAEDEPGDVVTDPPAV